MPSDLFTHEAPPSADLYTPCPYTPTYRVRLPLGLAGSRTMVVAGAAGRPLLLLVKVLQWSVDLHTPPGMDGPWAHRQAGMSCWLEQAAQKSPGVSGSAASSYVVFRQASPVVS